MIKLVILPNIRVLSDTNESQALVLLTQFQESLSRIFEGITIEFKKSGNTDAISIKP